jgi:predicted nucleic acid-binding protein
VIAYLDASVVLRIVLNEPEPLQEWRQIDNGITSEITRVECARVLDRLVNLEILQYEEIAEKENEVHDMLRRLDFVPLDRAVLHRASASYPRVVGTLDAIHLASALMYRDLHAADSELIFATHDRGLGEVARTQKFRVLGI